MQMSSSRGSCISMKSIPAIQHPPLVQSQQGALCCQRRCSPWKSARLQPAVAYALPIRSHTRFQSSHRNLLPCTAAVQRLCTLLLYHIPEKGKNTKMARCCKCTTPTVRCLPSIDAHLLPAVLVGNPPAGISSQY